MTQRGRGGATGLSFKLDPLALGIFPFCLSLVLPRGDVWLLERQLSHLTEGSHLGSPGRFTVHFPVWGQRLLESKCMVNPYYDGDTVLDRPSLRTHLAGWCLK